MTGYPTLRGLRRGMGALAMLAALPLAGCDAVENVLEVTDPDVVNPGDITTAPGARAVRLGALTLLNRATSGDESLWLYTGLFTDEFRSGDTFNQRDQTDKRAITYENGNVEGGYTLAHRARVMAEQALVGLAEHAPDEPAEDVAEMYLVLGYTENMLVEAFCSGVPFSNIVEGDEVYGEQLTAVAGYERALGHVNEGLALLPTETAENASVRNALLVIKGRILLNLDRPAEAAAAVASVPTAFRYDNQHSQTTWDNSVWSFNNSQRRWVVSPGEGTNGLNFAAANDPRVPVCRGGDPACRAIGITNANPFEGSASPVQFWVQRKYPTRASSAAIADGIEARLIEAEAALAAGQSGQSLQILNALRANPPKVGDVTLTALPALADAGSEAARVDQLFRERAFWLFATGHRLGDLRRLVRQYDRNPETVFPTGAFVKGGVYGNQVALPIPQAEENNPNIGAGTQEQICLDTSA